jgi:glycine/D-amino acid oxidase-like deaminating enzyme
MQPYYTRSIAMWKTAGQWLGDDVGFRERGGLTVAFNEKQADRATADFERRKQQEVEVELIDGDRARSIEPNLSKHAVLASYFPRDAVCKLQQDRLRLPESSQSLWCIDQDEFGSARLRDR